MEEGFALTAEQLGELVVANGALDDPAAIALLFDRDGYVFLRGVLDIAEVQRAKQDLVLDLQRQGAVVAGAADPIWTDLGLDGITDESLYGLDSYQALCESDRTRQVFEKVLGGPVHIFRSTTIRYALPSDAVHVTPAHQDHFFIGPNSDFRTAWIPLMTIDPALGGLALATASHKDGIGEHVEGEAESYILRGRKQKGVPLESITEEWVTTTYRPGDLLIFNSHTLHRALANRSHLIRLSLDTRVQPAGTPRSFQSTHTILEQRAHREGVRRLAFEEGATEPVFELVVHHMLKNGLQPERELIKELVRTIPQRQ